MRDFPGGLVAKTELPVQGVPVPSLVKKLDPACRNRVPMLQLKILHATTKIRCSQIIIIKRVGHASVLYIYIFKKINIIHAKEHM